jgi:hypothetical protein
MIWRGRDVLKERWKIPAIIVACSALAWIGTFMIHERFLSFLSHAPGIDLVFVPSGVRLIAIMIGGIWAVVGVSLGSLLMTGPEFHTVNAGTIMAVAACSGLCPYLALRASLRVTGVDTRLTQLSAGRLPVISLGVAVGSSLLHNLLFSLLGIQPWTGFTNHTLAMATGDFLGILLAVIAAFLFLRSYRKPLA